MNKHNTNFEDKLNNLFRQQQLSIAAAEQVDVYDDEFDGYVAYRLRNYMNQGVVPETGATIYYSKAEFILDRMLPFIPDMTQERLMGILNKMLRHDFLEFKDGYYYSVKVPMANMPLR